MQAKQTAAAGIRRASAPAPWRAAAAPQSLRATIARATAKQEARGSEASTTGEGGPEEIYIGFEKYDFDRAGRKGRVIRDDPRKYPARENLGFFNGATGGWAGGEAGLWQLREAVVAEQSGRPAPPPAKPAAAKPVTAPAGKAAIYVGFGKDELELRKSGAPGRVIVDDPARYPGKEDLGLFNGATGGFAGGEKGVRMLVETGELKLRAPGDLSRKRQVSSLALGAFVVAAAAGGGIILTDAIDLGEEVVSKDILDAPIDDSTKTLLLAAVALLVSVGAIAGGRAAVSTLQERLKNGAQSLVLVGGFFVAVFLAARAVLEL